MNSFEELKSLMPRLRQINTFKFSSSKINLPVVFVCNDLFLIQSSHDDPGNKNVSKTLDGKSKPPIAEIYNANMG